MATTPVVMKVQDYKDREVQNYGNNTSSNEGTGLQGS